MDPRSPLIVVTMGFLHLTRGTNWLISLLLAFAVEYYDTVLFFFYPLLLLFLFSLLMKYYLVMFHEAIINRIWRVQIYKMTKIEFTIKI